MEKLGIFKDKNDGSLKCVFSQNKNIIEMTLLFNRKDTDVVCVPTHHFCNLGCKMCHLTNNALNKCSIPIKYEDFDECLKLTLNNQRTMEKRTNKRKLLLSFMGVGEPTLNFNLIREVNKNIEKYKKELGYDEIGLAMATMMPNKNIENIIRIVNNENIPLKIHFSLHTPIDEDRNKLIPASKLNVKECFDYLKEYKTIISKNDMIMKEFGKCHRTNDLVEIHYTLIQDINDREKDLKEICKLLKEYGFTIKFIRFNPKEDMYISSKEQMWVEMIRKLCNTRVKTYSPPGKNVGSSCGEFTKHYYHEEIETQEQYKDFINWKKEYEVFD